MDKRFLEQGSVLGDPRLMVSPASWVKDTVSSWEGKL